MTDPYARLILDRLKDLHEDVLEAKGEAREAKEEAREAKEQSKLTNGRVHKLELWRARTEGAKAALGWVTPLLIALVSAVATAVLTYLLAV